MFDGLQNKLLAAITGAGGRGRLTAQSLESVISSMRMTLLEADVHFQVVKNFCDNLLIKLEGEKIYDTLTPEQTILKCARDELRSVLGENPIEFSLTPSSDPNVIFLVGLYGVGKTTHAAKLANYIHSKLNLTPLLVSCDASRPAAHEQLYALATTHALQVMQPPENKSFDPVKRVKEAKKMAKKQGAQVVIVDTAGRSSLDQSLIAEIKRLINKINPQHILLTLDAMLGQSSLQVAKTFHDACPLTGNIITKCDGDARGGVALSARLVTRRPIFFMGVGERVTDLEIFDPLRMASRLLDLGDMEGLFEKAAGMEKPANADHLLGAIQSGQFHLGHFKEQLKMMKGLGPLQGLLKMVPGMGKMMRGVSSTQMEQAQDSFKKFSAIIDSMTPYEREHPQVLNGSRRKRISAGSGTTPQDVNTLLRQFDQMKKMMKSMPRMGLLK